MAHEQQTKSLEEEFEKIRLSLQVRSSSKQSRSSFLPNTKMSANSFYVFPQDQVDTLTFQNRSLRDRAKRFEEALRRSTDEQIVVSAATT